MQKKGEHGFSIKDFYKGSASLPSLNYRALPFPALLTLPGVFKARMKGGCSKLGTGLKKQNRGLPGGFGFSFGGRFVLLPGMENLSSKGKNHRMGILAFVFLRRRQPPPKRGSVLRPLLSILENTLGTVPYRVVYPPFWSHIVSPSVPYRVVHS